MKIFKILPIVILLAGCASATAPSATLPVLPSVAQSTAQSAVSANAGATFRQANGPFVLTIDSPADQAVVSQPQLNLQGKVSEEAVLTINEDTYVLKPGSFTEPVKLDMGLNAIQITASDMSGNEVDAILTITYQP